MVTDFNTLSAGVLNGIISNFNGALVFTQKRDTSKFYTIVTQGLFHIEDLSTTSTGGNIFSFGDGVTEFCFLEHQDTEDLPSNWHPPVVLFRSILHPAKSESE